MEKPKVKEVIVVEGRYDKNTLSQVVDAVIVELGGFAVFNDKEKQAFLRKLAKERGIILFTDPDGAIRALLTGSKGAVDLALTLISTYGFWLGFFALLEKTGASKFIAKILRPVIRKLFKGESPETERYIAMNMSANLLGLGNAATPMGINAICAMDRKTPYATTNMIMLVVISATSLQLIPSTVIGMRLARGSTAPTAFLLPCAVSTVASTIFGVLWVEICAKAFGAVPRKFRNLKSADGGISGQPLFNGKAGGKA